MPKGSVAKASKPSPVTLRYSEGVPRVFTFSMRNVAAQTATKRLGKQPARHVTKFWSRKDAEWRFAIVLKG